MISRPLFRVIVLAVVVTSLLLIIGLFNLLFPQGLDDLLINQEWKAPDWNQQSPSRHVRNIAAMGREVMRQSTATFLGVGRDIGPRLPAFLSGVEALASRFAASQAIFVEGDSTDDSFAQLVRWAARSPANRTVRHTSATSSVETIAFPTVAGQPLPREGRLAVARNVALEAFESLKAEGRAGEFLVVIDMDVIGWSMAGVEDSFGRLRDPSLTSSSTPWDAICANGVLLHGVYRDTYAFRAAGLQTNHHTGGSDHLLYNITAEERLANRRAVKAAKERVKVLMDTSRGVEGVSYRPFEVESCFGGLAIYRSEVLKGCRYTHREELPPYQLDCEHVFFHRCLREKNRARIFSNPNMKLWYGHGVLEKLRLPDVMTFLFG